MMTVNELIEQLEALRDYGKGDDEITIEARGKLLNVDEVRGTSYGEVIISTWG